MCTESESREKRLVFFALPKGSPIIDLSPRIADFADTAAAVVQLDLVIMTDSAVAHLARRDGQAGLTIAGAGPALALELCQPTASKARPLARDVALIPLKAC